MVSRYRIGYLLGLLIMVGLVSSCAKKENVGLLPASLNGKRIEMRLTGSEAENRIAEMHDKEVASSESYIGHYGKGEDHSMLYISGFKSRQETEDRIAKMSEHIGDGSRGFAHHQEFNVNGKTIHVVLSMKQINYFFTKDTYLYWLTISFRDARKGLAELLQTDVNAIPPVKQQLGGLAPGS